MKSALVMGATQGQISVEKMSNVTDCMENVLQIAQLWLKAFERIQMHGKAIPKHAGIGRMALELMLVKNSGALAWSMDQEPVLTQLEASPCKAF